MTKPAKRDPLLGNYYNRFLGVQDRLPFAILSEEAMYSKLIELYPNGDRSAEYHHLCRTYLILCAFKSQYDRYLCEMKEGIDPAQDLAILVNKLAHLIGSNVLCKWTKKCKPELSKRKPCQMPPPYEMKKLTTTKILSLAEGNWINEYKIDRWWLKKFIGATCQPQICEEESTPPSHSKTSSSQDEILIPNQLETYKEHKELLATKSEEADSYDCENLPPPFIAHNSNENIKQEEEVGCKQEACNISDQFKEKVMVKTSNCRKKTKNQNEQIEILPQLRSSFVA